MVNARRLGFHVAIFGTLWFSASADPVFTQTPGIVDVSSVNSAELSWTIDQSFNDFLWSKIEGYCGLSRMYTFRKEGLLPPDPPYADRLQGFLRNNNYTHGFLLSEVTVEDTLCRYSIVITNSADGGPTNDQAWIRILGVPSVPVIIMNPTEAVAGTVVTLTCSASSTTQPPDPDLRPAMKYTWSRTGGSIPGDRHSVSGSNSEKLTIDTVQKQDNQQNYSCTAQEDGSTLSNSRNLKLNVKYRPGSAMVTADSSTVVEAVNDLRLTCSLPSGQEGNPAVYTYQWRRPDGSLYPTDTSPLLISRSVLSATDHQGTWQCTAQNDVGLGTAGQISITVNAKPSVTKQPTNTSPIINEDLHIECQFLAKPGASVSWRYGASGSPSPTALEITTTVTPSGLYNKTTSVISWRSGSSYSDRKAVSGQYTCVASNTAGTTESTTITLNIRYGPLSINLGPGSVTDEVVEGSGDTVSRTCAADCNPPCNYVWTNITSGQPVRNQALLDLGQPDRYDHGLYRCTANNTIWANNTQFSLTVFFLPEPSFVTSNQSTLIQGNSTSLICSVASRPDSTITLYNLTGNKVLESEISDNTARHTLPRVHCLDTGSYLCMARNSFLGAAHVENRTILMDVKCPPGIFKPYTNTEGAKVGDNVTFQVTLISNPKPVITTDNWSFIQNGTRIDTLPPNVVVGEGQATDRLTMVAMLYITNIQLDNYGIYTLTTSNGYGGLGPMHFTLTPQGPSEEPSAPQLETRTAVSLTISWIAGFNGGFMQTFSVLYRAQDSGEEISAVVDTDPAVNKGDEVFYKLSDPETILPATLYTIRVQAANQYQGGSTVYGDSADIGTKAKPEVVTDPQYNFNSTHMTVMITIQPMESVTHLVTRVCSSSDTATCNQENTTVTTADVTVTVELPEKSNTYTVSLTMYDGEDQVNKMETTEEVNGGPGYVFIVVGVVAAVLVTGLIIMFIVLWRKGILPKKEKQPSTPGGERLVSHHGAGGKANGINNPAASTTSVYSLAEEIEPYGTANPSNNSQAPANSFEINPYGTSNDARVSTSQIQIQDLPTREQGNQGPLNGDVYAEVNKSGKPAVPAGKPKTPVKPENGSRPVSVYPPAIPKTKTPENPPVVYAQVNKPKKTSAAPTNEAASSSATEAPPVYAQVNKTPKGDSGASTSNTIPIGIAQTDNNKDVSAKNNKKGFKLPFFKAKEKKVPAAGQPYENMELEHKSDGVRKPPVGKAYVNVIEGSGPEGPYSEVRVPGIGLPPEGEVAYQNYDGPSGNNPYANVDAHGKRPPREFQRVGVDGTLYAELEHMRAEQAAQAQKQPVVIHGAENKTEYASIDYNKLKKRKT